MRSKLLQNLKNEHFIDEIKMITPRRENDTFIDIKKNDEIILFFFTIKKNFDEPNNN